MSNLQEALAARKRIWGGWVVGPTIIGPEEYARAGYDYVGFDLQHGYFDDADVALLLRRLEHVPIATAVRLPSTDPAPIGRVLDAGADAVLVAMIESADQAAEAVAATRYPPTGVRSFGPLLGSLGHDPAALEARVSVFAMVETTRGPRSRRRNLCCPRAFGHLCGARGSRDLDGAPPGRCVDAAGSARRDGANPVRHRRRPAWQRASTPATARGETSRRSWVFEMITLASESQALRRGAAEHLREATR